uniref:CAZy families CBM54 protein n=1 Tax=uncultured Caldicellulosiruptor sp. TaxID=569407 RepID=A0A060BW69_9FIRM|nr:CAZy families CBM54 protein [uncultured Caldicellulosiruptor sp.]
MELLSSYLGLQTALIRGSSGGVGHMWNVVYLSGTWYNLDLTWSDGNQPIYNYFNITDQVLKQTHEVAPAASTLTAAQLTAANSQVNLFLPSCTATAENYI